MVADRTWMPRRLFRKAALLHLVVRILYLASERRLKSMRARQWVRVVAAHFRTTNERCSAASSLRANSQCPIAEVAYRAWRLNPATRPSSCFVKELAASDRRDILKRL